MKQNYKIFLCALLLVGAVSMMTARAQGSGNKPTLAVFVVGMDNTLGDALATQIGSELNRNSRYTVLSSAVDPVKTKLTELRTQGARNIDRNALATWGRTNGVSTICLVTDDVKGNDNMFYAQLIDTKDSKLNSRGSYVRTSVATGDLPRVSLALAKQLEGQGRRHSAPATARSYPAELDIEMVRVEGGTFKVGCNGTTDVQESDGKCFTADKRETPQRTITVSSFSIGKYEITQAQWRAVMKGHPTLSDPASWKTGDDQLPIENICWFDVDTAFLPRLRALTGKQYRLPTNAEWEYAARGCKAGVCDPYKYSGSDVLGDVAWYGENSGSRTHPVGQKKPNGLGIYDMSGNVWEWCSDWFDTNYYTNTLKDGDVNPTGPTGLASGTARVERGGGWGSGASPLSRVACFSGTAPSSRGNTRGIRVVLP
jgi:formylglycine-generating enzyme required for sulfatase activity